VRAPTIHPLYPLPPSTLNQNPSTPSRLLCCQREQDLPFIAELCWGCAKPAAARRREVASLQTTRTCQNAAQTAPRLALHIQGQFLQFLTAPLSRDPGEKRLRAIGETSEAAASQKNERAHGDLRPLQRWATAGHNTFRKAISAQAHLTEGVLPSAAASFNRGMQRTREGHSKF
jgi:hypothetical protein